MSANEIKTPGPAHLAVRVLPGASKNEVVGLRDGTWKVRLTAPPIDGRANQALREFMADRLGINRSQVKLIKGATSRNKELVIFGLTADEIQARLTQAAS